MLEFILGIIVGATFADFWRYLYRLVRTGFRRWMARDKTAHQPLEP